MDTVDGLTVSYVGAPKAGVTEPLLFSIRAGGRLVVPEPYLGAYGHLVALRSGDLGYLHVHAEGDEPTADGPEGRTAGPTISFATTAPTAGRYLLYLDFQVAGVVHTAAFTLAVT